MSDLYVLHPAVSEASEFLEIARDFTNPLEAVREAISNAFDAGAKLIQIRFLVEDIQGEGQLAVVFQDNGRGMGKDGLQAFFDLGNSMSRGKENAIGAKGHGTKVFFGCDELVVETVGPDKVPRLAKMMRPLESLYQGVIPDVEVTDSADISVSVGTKITLRGFNRSRRDIFTHDQLKDYILWFTKFGSIEREFKMTDHRDKKLVLQGVDSTEPETLKFGHVFAKETKDIDKLFDRYMTDAPKHFVRKWVRTGKLKNHPEIGYCALFAIEGDSAKRRYNKMLTGKGRQRKPGMYKVTERYGLYLCKDFMPVERTAGWLGARSTDHLLYHAFINCQGFQLTANRGSVSNTPQPILDDVREVVEHIRQEIIASDEYDAMMYLLQEATGFETVEREKKQYERRLDHIKRQKTAVLDGVTLREPRQESGVLALAMQLMTLRPDLLPFEMADYDTSVGIDALVKTRDSVDVGKTELRYAEFKHLLEATMNHSFRHMYCVVAWDIHPSLKHESHVRDLTKEVRTFRIVPPKDEGDRTRYYLDSDRHAHKIEVFALRPLLKDALGLEFQPNAATGADPP